jgi:hypothetical protein
VKQNVEPVPEQATPFPRKVVTPEPLDSPQPAAVVAVQVPDTPQHAPVTQGADAQVVPAPWKLLELVAPQAVTVRSEQTPAVVQQAPALAEQEGTDEHVVLLPRYVSPNAAAVIVPVTVPVVALAKVNVVPVAAATVNVPLRPVGVAPAMVTDVPTTKGCPAATVAVTEPAAGVETAREVENDGAIVMGPVPVPVVVVEM